MCVCVSTIMIAFMVVAVAVASSGGGGGGGGFRYVLAHKFAQHKAPLDAHGLYSCKMCPACITYSLCA